MLEILNIHKSFDGKEVLHDVSITIPQGATHALIGSSGSGKTTLLRVTLGLIPFDKGYVKINQQKLLSYTPSEWSKRIGYVPQDGGLFPHLSARKNITLVADLKHVAPDFTRSRMEELAKLVGLDNDLLSRYPSQLSGGQKQRASIMRAAFLDPAVLILDEPMGALDPIVRRSLQEELKSIFAGLGKTVLIVTHDLGEAAYFAEKITLLSKGRVLQTGTYRDLCTHPADPFVSVFIHAQRTLPGVDK